MSYTFNGKKNQTAGCEHICNHLHSKPWKYQNVADSFQRYTSLLNLTTSTQERTVSEIPEIKKKKKLNYFNF